MIKSSDKSLNDPILKRIVVRVEGRVQGVGFRYNVRERAIRAGIYGYVRNLPDGAVYIEIEGEESTLLAMLRWLSYGPPRARVDRLTESEEVPKGYSSFMIR